MHEGLVEWMGADGWMYLLAVFLDGACVAAMVAMVLWTGAKDALVGKVNKWLAEHGIDHRIGGDI